MAEGAARIVDVGAGSGHFTRLASTTFGRDAVGIERDPGRVARAEALAPRPGTARFVVSDACREGLSLAPNDLAVGLHACGELGDKLVLAAAEAGCDLALVSCCLQKIPGAARSPLSAAGEGLTFPRSMLGLTNLTADPQGVEASLESQLAAREARYALRRLLAARGIDVAPGEEMRGINRRRARAGLAEIAGRALALRGLPLASDAEISAPRTGSRAAPRRRTQAVPAAQPAGEAGGDRRCRRPGGRPRRAGSLRRGGDVVRPRRLAAKHRPLREPDRRAASRYGAITKRSATRSVASYRNRADGSVSHEKPRAS